MLLLLRQLGFVLRLFCLTGPGVGGDYGPYRQSERNSMYKQYADKLLESGHIYRCFCSNEIILFLICNVYNSWV